MVLKYSWRMLVGVNHVSHISAPKWSSSLLYSAISWLFSAAIECKAPSVYQILASACPATCTDPNARRGCSEKPVEGCDCPDGFLLDGDNCVPPDECGCRYRGQIYPVSIRSVLLQSSVQIVQFFLMCAAEGHIDQKHHDTGVAINRMKFNVSKWYKLTLLMSAVDIITFK